MLKFRFLFKINSKFRIICVEFEKHFDDINILFCDDFVQLFSIENIFLYFQFRYMIFDFQIAIFAYMTFIEFIFLTQLMRQNEMSNFANRFRITLTQIRDESMSIEH